jgi:ribosomal-protein-alanine N-acetyltransferase
VKFYIEPMQAEDVPEVSEVERQCFTNPWPQSAYRRELRNGQNNSYIVLRRADEALSESSEGAGEARGRIGLLPFRRRTVVQQRADPIIGFAGMWVVMDEAHITTIGVLPEHRGQGLGELLLVTLFSDAMRRGAEWVTLEVRVSNDSAQALYQKYGFTRQGVRRRYYSDNGEDAYIMWSPPLREPEYVRRFHELRSALNTRMAGLVGPAPERAGD